ncbi:MAG TPA: dTMP kinase [Bacillota bacterium]|nr:dTMP kinase [Bacillota bacterium]HPT86426.1 dTMP kinase [Bacillota bacterium]
MAKGYLITFEGLDGSGKSTQALKLKEALSRKGYSVVLTREPGGTPLAEEIRRVILTPTTEPLVPMAEILLYAASRAQHVENLIKPALAEGKIVISDRFIDSSIAYQGYGLGWDVEVVKAVNRMAVNGLMPDLTFFIDVSVEKALERIKGRQHRAEADRIESREMLFHRKVREGFIQLSKSDSRFVRVESEEHSIESIHRDIMEILQRKLNI